MKVTGFSFVRNAIKFDYPIVEAVTSILPLCDEFVVAVGNSEDDTLRVAKSIESPKIRVIETVWDDSLREGGRTLALETDKAFAAISPDTDWAFYIQGDEVVHERYHTAIAGAMQRWRDDKRVEGLLLNYLHFYGSYDFIGDSRRWYRREIRVLKYDRDIRSFRDAQGFRLGNRIMRVKPVEAFIYHYGWARAPALQQAKQRHFHKMWHDDEWMKENIPKADLYDYSRMDSLARFTGTHPAVMRNRISNGNWMLDFDPARRRISIVTRLFSWIERKTKWRAWEYRNFKIV